MRISDLISDVCSSDLVDAEVLGVLYGPAQRGEAVVERGGRLVLGGEAVVDRHHDGARAVGEGPAGGIGGGDVADHPATAVEPHEHAGLAGHGIGRRVDPYGDVVTFGHGHVTVVDPVDLLEIGRANV